MTTGSRRVNLETLTEDQWADLERLVMILWGTKPLTGIIAIDGPDEKPEEILDELLCGNGW